MPAIPKNNATEEINKRKQALLEIRKKIGAPFLADDFKPLTRNELYER